MTAGNLQKFGLLSAESAGSQESEEEKREAVLRCVLRGGIPRLPERLLGRDLLPVRESGRLDLA